MLAFVSQIDHTFFLSSEKQHEKDACNQHIDYPTVNCINAAQATSNTGTYGKFSMHSQGHISIYNQFSTFGMSYIYGEWKQSFLLFYLKSMME